jgi:hypothetical protein
MATSSEAKKTCTPCALRPSPSSYRTLTFTHLPQTFAAFSQAHHRLTTVPVHIEFAEWWVEQKITCIQRVSLCSYDECAWYS